MFKLDIFTAYFDPEIKLPPFFMPPGHPSGIWNREVNCCLSWDMSADNLSDQGHIPGIQDKGYSFRLMKMFVENKTRFQSPLLIA